MEPLCCLNKAETFRKAFSDNLLREHNPLQATVTSENSLSLVTDKSPVMMDRPSEAAN